VECTRLIIKKKMWIFHSVECTQVSAWPVVEALEGKWASRMTIEQRRGTLYGVGQACGD